MKTIASILTKQSSNTSKVSMNSADIPKPPVSRETLFVEFESHLLSICQKSNLKETIFDEVIPPKTLKEILDRIRNYDIVCDECIYTAMIYMKKYLTATASCLTQTNLPSLFLVSVMIATKFMDDVTYTSLTFANMSELPIRVLNILEVEFLTIIDYQLHITAEEMSELSHHFQRRARFNKLRVDTTTTTTTTNNNVNNNNSTQPFKNLTPTTPTSFRVH